MATEVKERSVPKPVFTDAEAGAKEFPSWQSRSYNYFTPRKRRATVYEDVTVDVQPDPARHLTQGWVYAFANGDSGYPRGVDGAEVAPTGTSSSIPTRSGSRRSTATTRTSSARSPQNIEHGRTAHVFAGA